MADKRCFVQFPHPGGEHGPRSGSEWNRTKRDHQRKFMQFRGKWIDEDRITHTDNLRAWGEWEPESKLICKFDPENGRPHHPRHLWKPYWIRKEEEDYRCLHNTDPFIFGDCFLYSNCGQSAPSKKGLKNIGVGSVIAFGSGKTIGGKRKWVLDTVLVVRESRCYDPLDPRMALEGKVPEAFLKVTGGPLTSDPKLKKSADDGYAKEFRLYWGATPDDPVDEMFSFFPAVLADRESSFARPIIDLKDNKVLNPDNWQTPKGAGTCRQPQELRRLWDSLVEQVLGNKNLVLGTHAEMPPGCRAE